LPNQSLLAGLIAKHGAAAGLAVFNDVRWRNDPDAAVTIPGDGAFGKIQRPSPPHPAQLRGVALNAPATDADVGTNAILQSLGVPIGFGSHAWVVSAAKSAQGVAMLFGGPQFAPTGNEPNLTDVAPAIMHEVQLTGGNDFHVTGIAFAGAPVVAIGRTDHIAWTITAASAVDNTDIYIETLCANGTGYMFNGACTPFQSRTETINVHGGAPVQLRVLRSVHGPIVAPSTTTASGACSTASAPGFCFTRKRVFALRGLEEFRALLMVTRAHNLQEFEAGVHLIVAGGNFLYADKVGNIAYWQAGLVPVRAPGFDPRLPLPGDGSAEWTGEFVPIPRSINPPKGWLANWNNKPLVEWDNPDHQNFGKRERVREIEVRLSGSHPVSMADMMDIATDIARTDQGGSGRRSRFLKPYLLAALDHVPSVHPLAPQARAVLESWDGSRFANALSSTHLEPGEVVFSKWLEIVRSNTFGDELGDANLSAGSANVLIHLLDHALGSGSSVPPSRDYFNGVDPNVVISASFDQALTQLGPDPAVWSTQARATVSYRHMFFPAVREIGTILDSNRGTYAQIVVLSNPRITAENILTLGQSGFIGSFFDQHFADQLPLYRNFKYKAMRLYRNIQLQE
jgi:penicillin amidase